MIARRGPLLLAVLYLIPVALWATAGALEARFAGTHGTLRQIGVAAGLMGATAYAMNFVLGARVRPVEAIFGGIDRMYRVHQLNGRLAFWLVVIHAALITASEAVLSGDAALALFTGGAGWNVTLGVVALVGTAVVIGITLRGRVNHEVFVYAHRFFGLFFLLGAVHYFMMPGTKAMSRPLTYYMLAITSLGLLGFAYRSVFEDVLVPRHRYRVSRVRHLDNDVMEITMSPLDWSLQHIPGQFIFVTFHSRELDRHFQPISIATEGQLATVTLRPGDVSRQFHPFSLTSAPGDRDVMVVVKAVGDYTTAMRNLEEGAYASVEGPYGSFSYVRVENRSQIWIAGGIGVTPFLSMARSLTPDTDLEIDFYYCMDRADQGYFLDEFRAIADANPRLRVVPVTKERLGFIQVADIEGVSGDLSTKDILMCGPPAMMDNLRGQFLARGVPDDQIHFERFGFVG